MVNGYFHFVIERQCFENSDCTGTNTMCDMSSNTCVCDPTYQHATIWALEISAVSVSFENSKVSKIADA